MSDKDTKKPAVEIVDRNPEWGEQFAIILHPEPPPCPQCGVHQHQQARHDLALLRLPHCMEEAGPVKNHPITAPAPPETVPVCLRCFSTATVPIWYGSPTPECFEWDRQGLIHLGGCVVCGREPPNWHCRTCDCDFRVYVN